MNEINIWNNPYILSYISPKEYTNAEPAIPTIKANKLIFSEKHIIILLNNIIIL